MDYKQKYEQAIENIKKIKAANKDNKSLVDFMDYKYPELKENEDEKIRNWLIDTIKQIPNDSIEWEMVSTKTINKENVVAWLEKQSRQKSTWSEEDERLLKLSLENLTELKNRFGEKYGKVGECIYWLKSLKQRIKGK